jgi:4-amino-4-deoxy-L-arabinose transferase-like glycosyltransferase
MAALGTSTNPRQRLWLGLALALLTFVAIVSTLSDVGVTWDEPLYIKASRGYMTWLGMLRRDPSLALSDSTIVRWWVQDPTLELHPPVGKLLSGLTWAAFRGVIGDISAHRLSNAGLFSLMVAMVFWMVSSAFDAASGIFAALSLLFMPRMFLHAHLANIDTTIAITCFLATYLFWKLESRSTMQEAARRDIWLLTLATGLAFGLALATKLNAVVLPVVWLVWILLFHRTWQALCRLAVIGLTGAATFLVTWPWLYYDTASRLVYYISMASRFKDRPQFYLGQVMPHVSWHYPFVITLAVVPLVITVMYFLGGMRVLRSRPAHPAGWLFILSAALPLFVAATGLQAAYSGERHFIPAYPYLACLAGVGFGELGKTLIHAWEHTVERRPARDTRHFIWPFLLLLMLPTGVTIARLHPYELSYYSEAVGGLQGATRIGLETTFWCETYRDALPFLNTSAEQGASVWVENPYVLRLYQQVGLLRPDLVATGGDTVNPQLADLAVVEMRQTGFAYTPEIVDILTSRTPVYSLARFGVPLMHVFQLGNEG